MPFKYLLLSFLLILPCYVTAISIEDAAQRELHCKNISNKLASVNFEECLAHEFDLSDTRSVKGAPLFVKDFYTTPASVKQKRIMLIGGIHGDEYASVSIVFKWIALLNQYGSDDYQWKILPLLNPDGLLQQSSKITNANGVDLNRNFPVSADSRLPDQHQGNISGKQALSEPESEWLAKEIARYRPDAVITVHAPHNSHDYQLLISRSRLPELGAQFQESIPAYAGSFNQYVGSEMNIPILTVELPYAEIMPSKSEISEMWQHVNNWLDSHLE